VISTFVFCTVPNPLKGLEEVYRVLKPGGKAVFLEHMRSRSPFVNLFLGLMNLYSRPVLGTSMLRRTQENIILSGFNIVLVEHLLLDVVRLIVGKKPL
jgi:ubiquinone/menaquinone biosynthesis C-methylase UbiE